MKETDLPAIVLQDQEQEKKYIKEGITPSDIAKFFEDLKVPLLNSRRGCCYGWDLGPELSKIQRFKD